jgi:Flp pilus assembly pilin Flp
MLRKLLVSVLARLHREEGQDMIEYALIAAVIAIPIVLATVFILDPAFTAWANDVADNIRDAPLVP